MTLSTLMVTLMLSGASGSADALVKVEHPPLKLAVPAAWKSTVQEGTRRYTAPSGDAYFLLDTGRTEKPMNGGECRDKILSAMKVEDAEKLSIGKAPAAKQVTVDRSPDGKNEVQTLTFIGCDGNTTWSLVFHLVGKKQKRYVPLADKIAKSIEYL